LLFFTLRPPGWWDQTLAERTNVALLILGVLTIVAVLATVGVGLLQKQKLRFECRFNVVRGVIFYYFYATNAGAHVNHYRIEVFLNPDLPTETVSGDTDGVDGQRWQRRHLGAGSKIGGWETRGGTLYREQSHMLTFAVDGAELPRSLGVRWWTDRSGPNHTFVKPVEDRAFSEWFASWQQTSAADIETYDEILLR
jgi:hypothetical protein